MTKLTLGQVKPTIARVAGLCSTDSRIVSYVNEATQRLVSRGKWVGTVQRYRVCVNDGCIVWPRQIETIEQIAICERPGVVRNEWFEFDGNGFGLMDSEDCLGDVLIDRGTVCSFDTIAAGATDRKIRVYADVAEDEDAVITLQGYDENGNWIRTEVDDEWIDGEQVAISTTPTLSTKKFTHLTGVIKPVTNGFVRLYEYQTTAPAANVKSLAVYEPDETLPVYRKSLIPGLADMAACSGSETDCESKYVTVMAKLRFIPVVNDNDWLLIGNLGALKLAVQAVIKEDKDLHGEADTCMAKAVFELEKELQSYLGDGAKVPIRIENPSLYGGGGVCNIL